jgi:hypothetical protein
MFPIRADLSQPTQRLVAQVLGKQLRTSPSADLAILELELRPRQRFYSLFEFLFRPLCPGACMPAAHGGPIDVTSNDEATRFTFQMPLAPEERATLSPVRPAAAST